MELFTLGSHGSTFGGNPLAAAVAMEALAVLKDEKLAERSAELGAYLMEKLQRMRSPLIAEVRGKGLWVGIVIDPAKASARTVCELLMDKGLLAKETHQTVVRLAPPLVITRDELDWALDQVASTLKELLS